MRKHLYHCVIFQKVPKLSFEFFFGPHQHERVICVFRRRRFFFVKSPTHFSRFVLICVFPATKRNLKYMVLRLIYFVCHLQISFLKKTYN